MCMKYEELINKKFNKLTIIEILPKNETIYYMCLCKCDCGKEKIYPVTRVKMSRFIFKNIILTI